MRILFLGSGGVHGVPVWNCGCEVCTSRDPKDKRLRPALFVQTGNKNIAIDFGPDFRTQLLKYNIRKLDYAFLTHAHGDHMNDFMQLSKQDNLILEAPDKVLEDFFERLGSSKEWLQTRNPSIKITAFKGESIGNVTVDSVALEHQKDYIKEVTPCFGYLFKSKKFRFAYLSDYSRIIEKEKVLDLDLLISDGSGFEKSKTGHMGVKGSLEIFRELNPRMMVLTHIEHTKSHEFLSNYVKKFGNIKIAFDGMEISAKE